MTPLAEVFSAAVEAVLRGCSVNETPALQIHTAISKVLAAEVGVRERDQEHLASLLATTFLGIPPGFSPRQTFRVCDKNSLERLAHVMDERGDGSEGAFVFVQLDRAEREDKHVPGRPWEFIRYNRYVGEARFYLKERMRSGDPCVVVGVQSGAPDFDTYVSELAVEVAAKGGCLEFPASTVPGFSTMKLQYELNRQGFRLLERTRRAPNAQYMTRYFVVEKR